MAEARTPYEAAVDISREFLGPAGERFLRRQIATHLGIEPEELKPEHLEELVNWVRLTFAVLTDDAALVEEFARDLRALGKPSSRSAKKVTHGRAR